MMRIFFLATFVANIVLTLVSWVILPDNVAIHFRGDGMPDGWAPIWFHVLIFLGIHLVLFVTVFFGSRLSVGLPARWANLPNKNYWLREENKARTQKILSSMMLEFGTAMFLFLFFVGILTTQANLSNPVRLDNALFWPAFILFMAFMGYWCIKLILLFRVPKDKPSEPGAED
jgi:hypothetical protein